MNDPIPSIAYFSMEIALEKGIPTYAGGLGILAGDTIRSAADQEIPMVAMTLLYRKGYFHQTLDESGWQIEEPVAWRVNDYFTELPARVTVSIEGRHVTLRAWKYEMKGAAGHAVTVYLLDADVEGNSAADRTFTHSLYGGDEYYRLCQEVILGIGGLRMLRALGYRALNRYHMNEGHASLLVLELLQEQVEARGAKNITRADFQAVRPHCVFTTHTPVPAGHDKFPMELVQRVFGADSLIKDMEAEFCHNGMLNLTFLALNNSHFINGVAKKHKEVTQLMFGSRYEINSITNGIHVATWISQSMWELFERYIPGWQEDNASLRYAMNIPKQEIWEAHQTAKKELLEYVNRNTNAGMDRDVLTIGFARRAAPYKRSDLLFQDVNRLKQIVEREGALQILYAGKAHPRDQHGKEIIQHIHRIKDALHDSIAIAYLPEYDMALGKLLVAGCDIWLNNPQPPLEASGTSGMKAAANGVPSLSILDGWWIEGCIEGITGWAIGNNHKENIQTADRSAEDAAYLYDKLERIIVPLFYRQREKFIDVMRHAIALNGSFFNTERMLSQYVTKAYFK